MAGLGLSSHSLVGDNLDGFPHLLGSRDDLAEN